MYCVRVYYLYYFYLVFIIIVLNWYWYFYVIDEEKDFMKIVLFIMKGGEVKWCLEKGFWVVWVNVMFGCVLCW